MFCSGDKFYATASTILHDDVKDSPAAIDRLVEDVSLQYEIPNQVSVWLCRCLLVAGRKDERNSAGGEHITLNRRSTILMKRI